MRVCVYICVVECKWKFIVEVKRERKKRGIHASDIVHDVLDVDAALNIFPWLEKKKKEKKMSIHLLKILGWLENKKVIEESKDFK